jgi:ParB family chromosome partitioning protein
MTDVDQNIQPVAIADITVLNPRVRNKRSFTELVNSIAVLGLKKPITVSRKPDGTGFSLVCGQGRMEAFVALGQTEIPAIVIEADEEDCLVRSLVENLARRNHSGLELIREIVVLRERGYTQGQIATKTGFSDEYIYAIFALFDKGEERLLTAVDKGIIPPSIAIEIARAKDNNVQTALAEAYENKALPGNQILAIRRIVEKRNAIGKGLGKSAAAPLGRRRVSATTLVRAYQKETERQKLLVKKATLTQTRLLFIVNALKHLLADDHFTTLLRAESLATMPRPINERIRAGGSL